MTKHLSAEVKQVTDSELEFYIECAELAGMSLEEWFISEPF